MQALSLALRRRMPQSRIMTKAAVFCLAAGVASAQTVSLTVNTGTVLHGIDEKIYGQSLQPLHHSVNGGLRPDLTEAVAALHPPILRWPGGSFVGKYKWKDGIGPRSKRVDPLSFGIDEFLAFARKVGAEPVVVIPVGPRNPVDQAAMIRDAVDLVAYCNGPPDSAWGKIRAQNGHPEPYRVKYWEIDNEISGMPATDYIEVLGQFAPAMRKVDPNIRIIGQGDLADYLSVHDDERSKNPKRKLFVSGWNAQSGDWRGGLHAGTILNALERDAAVAMASPSSDNALINFGQRSWFPSPNYVVMKLYRDHFAPELLAIAGSLGDLSATATRTADGDKIYLKLVNPGDQAVAVEVALRGDFPLLAASMQLVAPDSLAARNTLEQPTAVQAVLAKVASIVHRDPAVADGKHILEPVKVWNAVAGSAQIVTGGVKTIPAYDPLGVLQPGGPGAYSNGKSWYAQINARSAIGISKDGATLVLFTVDARGGSAGMSVGEVADVLIQDYGVGQALNLDGGGSTTLAIDGRIVNVSSDNPGGRKVGSSLAVFAGR